MDIGAEILSRITIFSKYAKYIPEVNRRETWDEIVDRYELMLRKKFPSLKKEIIEHSKFIRDKKVLPSMRAMQFAGPAAEINPSRIFNCCFFPVNNIHAFSEGMFLLLGGTGVGYSVQTHHVEELPEIIRPFKSNKYVIQDSIIGWSDAVKVLMKSYFGKGAKPIFDFRDIRPKGSRLITAGGKAPGPEPLKICLAHIEVILERKQTGEKLTALECHDIMCHIANSVLSGGIRRAAMISLFSFDDDEMLTCKYGNWWELNEQRGRANNSAVIDRRKIRRKDFDGLWKKIQLSGCGEPGIFFTNNYELGTNPCKPLDSTILTPSGYITFAEALEMDKLKIITPDGRTVKASKPFLTGVNKKVYEILLSNGQKILGTDNHLHLNSSKEWKRIDELKIGDRLRVADNLIVENASHSEISISNYEEYEKGLLRGWLLGDGWNYKRSDSKNSYRAGLCFGNHEKDVISLFENILNKKSKPHFQKTETCDLLYVDQSVVDIKDKWELPFLKKLDYKLGFLQALFTADGSCRNRTNSVELYSINRKILEGISLILQEFGIRSTVTVHNYDKSYIAKDGKIRNNSTCYKVVVSAGQFKRIGFISKFKQDLLQKQNDKGLYRRKDYETVVDIKLRSIEDVYDITVYDDCHSFIDRGIISHNCCEISLKAWQFCNLTEVNVSDIQNEKDLNDRVRVAAFFGTLQAAFTDFHYLRAVWQKTTEKDALLGIGMTGIASGEVLKYDLTESTNIAKEENERVAELIGINKAARLTCVKPSGTTSCVLGTSSGIHAWHNDYYLRTMRFNQNEDISKYLKKHHPEICENDILRPHDTLCVRIPVKAPEGSIVRTESAIDLLERVKKFSIEWIRPGHRRGDNHNNVSATVSIKDEEWHDVGEWMWSNKEHYTGLSVLPFSGGTYVQAPFEDINEEEYITRSAVLHEIDLTKVKEEDDKVMFSETVACGGGACEIV